MQVYVDGDAFPRALKELVFRAAERVRVRMTFVANQYVRVPPSDYIVSLTVPDGPDVVDDRIVQEVAPGDLVITADIPLADRVVRKGAYALDPRGDLYTDVNIQERLATRHLMDELRSDGLITGGPASFGQKDLQNFANQLDRFLTKHGGHKGA